MILEIIFIVINLVFAVINLVFAIQNTKGRWFHASVTVINTMASTALLVKIGMVLMLTEVGIQGL